MKKASFYIIFLLLSFQAYAQDDYQSLMKQGQTASEQGKYLIANINFKKAAALQPLNENTLIQLSWNYLLLKNYEQAKAYAQKAFYLNQSNLSCYTMLGCALIALGDKNGEGYIKTSIALSPPDYQQYFLLDFKGLREAGVEPDFFTDDRVIAYFNEGERKNEAVTDLFDSIAEFYANELSIDQIISKVEAAPLPDTFKAYYINLFADALANDGYNEAARSMILVGRKMKLSDPVSAQYIQTGLAVSLMRISNYAGEYEESTKYYEETVSNNWNTLEDMGLGHSRMESCLLASQAYNAIGELNSQEEVARKLISASGTHQDLWYQTNGFNSLGTVKLNSSLSADRSAALNRLKTALSMAKRNGFDSLIPSIAGNLAISYWQHGNKEEAKRTYVNLSEEAIANDDFLSAELYLNNLASMYFYNEDYRTAAQYFQQSIDLIEQLRDKVPDASRITFLQARQSSYTFLASCLVKLGDGERLFNAQEDQRARVLAELLNSNTRPNKLSLGEFQQMLSPDQAALYYTLMETGAVIITVVTKEGVHAIRHEAFDQFIAFKNKYLSRMQSSYSSKEGYKPAIADRIEGGVHIQESDKARLLNTEDFELMIEFSRQLLQDEKPDYAPIRNEFLSMLNDFLIAPIQSHVDSKKSLLISPDGLLNFVPFESLTNSSGTYLIQSHDVNYIQSGTVFRSLQNRNYPANRKGMLAFGGATYDKMNVKADPIRGTGHLNNVKLNTSQKIKSGQSLREEYAAIGFGKMNYLPGTLAEVQGLSSIVPNSTVYQGAEFDESFIKKLSEEQQLSQYKVVHFATHGFAIPTVPQLSGIATSIFAEEKNNEDGYLNVNEISKLNLQADLAVLSACETGLGKIYGGEGVFGLTQALLVAGANEAAVSLWAVSDQGTMYFMRGMYELVIKHQYTYSAAMAEMKRQFISGKFGERFQHPNYWAPFVHYGKTTAYQATNTLINNNPAVVEAPKTSVSENGIFYHTESIYKLKISPNNQLIATAGDDDRIIIWDASTLKPIKELSNGNGLKGLHFNTDATAIYTYSNYNELNKYDLSNGAVTNILPKGSGDVTTTDEWVAGSIISVFKNSIVEFIELKTGKTLSKIDLGESGYIADFIPLIEEDRFILSFITWKDGNERIEIYKTSTGELVQTIKTKAVDIYYDKTENALFTIKGSRPYAARKINLETLEIQTLEVERGSLLIMTDNGKFMTNKYSIINDEGIHFIHDTKTGSPVFKIQLKGFQDPKLALDNGQILLIDSTGRLRMLDINSGKLIK